MSTKQTPVKTPTPKPFKRAYLPLADIRRAIDADPHQRWSARGGRPSLLSKAINSSYE